MAGFKSIKEACDADDNGKSQLVVYAKNPGTGVANPTFAIVDFSTLPGYPVANIYASLPQYSAYVNPEAGIKLPLIPANERMYLFRTTCMASGAASLAHRTEYLLADYLLFYPFFDMERNDTQLAYTSNPLTRYTDGKGVQIMVISQSATTGGGSFNINYINQNGNPAVTPDCGFAGVSLAGCSQVSTVASSNPQMFVPLAPGDTGVRSITGFTVVESNSGVCAIVLVYPIARAFMNEDSYSEFGDAWQMSRIQMQAGMPEIKPGACLNFMGRPTQGAIANYRFLTYLDLIWG